MPLISALFVVQVQAASITFSTAADFSSGNFNNVIQSGSTTSAIGLNLTATVKPTSGVYTSDIIDLGLDVSSIDSISWNESGVKTGDGETPYQTDGLVAQWNFNSTSGTVAVNDGGPGSCGGTPGSCNGTLTNFGSGSSGQDILSNSGWTAVNKKWGAGALKFDGSDDYIIVPTNNSIEAITGNLTISAWVYWEKNGSPCYIVSKGSGNDYTQEYEPTIQSNGEVSFAIGNSSGSDYGVNYHSGYILQVNQWHYLSFVVDGSTANIYADGVKQGPGATIISRHNNNDNLRISGRPLSSSIFNFSGVLDSLSLYSRVLSENEILSNYQAGNIELATRTSSDGVTWESWSANSLTDPDGSIVSSPLHRYIQYRATLTTTDAGLTPNLGPVTINYTNGPIGYKAKNLPEELIASTTGTWEDDISTTPVTGVKEIGLRESETNRRIAEFTANFNSNIDFSGVTADSEGTKSFFHLNSQMTNMSAISGGESSSYTLYIPKGEGDKVWICPGVSSLLAVSLNCGGGYFLTEGQSYNGATASVSNESDGITYWKVSGLTGTGGMSVATKLRDTLSRLQVSQASDHTITFGTNDGLTANGQTLVLAFDPATKAFDLSDITLSDIQLTDNLGNDRILGLSPAINTWGISIDSVHAKITFTAPTSGTGYYPAAAMIVIKIGKNAISGANQVGNPALTGTYYESLVINNTGKEEGTIAIPIIDSDQVNVTGYINTFINFDIDTGTTDTDCAYNTCLNHSGGTSAANYVVDLGELNSTWVNKSEDASFMHSDGNNGTINSIYFDLTTNAYNGAVLYVKSANGGLQGPGTNLISSVTDGNNIQVNDGAYGFQLTDTGSGNGMIVRNANCTNTATYCGLSTSQKEIFNTDSKPLDNGRIRMDLAAASSYVNNPGSYTDTLTFIVTASY